MRRVTQGGSAVKLTPIYPMVVLASIAAAADVPSAQVQIAGAVLAAPAELREGAAVLGYDAQGARVQIREGKNELICSGKLAFTGRYTFGTPAIIVFLT